ncbi:MAG: radical SAM/SPASM domain-containing protein [Candidatus Woesearchaeota archaeon]
MSKINEIQIQTYNMCNSKCIMCPYKDISDSPLKMEDSLFIKIIDNIVDGINEGLIKIPYIHPFFQNEPFMDKSIFDKVEYIQEKIPDAYISIITNGTFFNIYKEKITKMKIDELKFSLYGEDLDSFNYITNLNYKIENYLKMVEAAVYIAKNSSFEFILDSTWKNEKTRGFSSRAGFLSNNKIIHNVVNGCKWKRDEWLHILADGIVVICCMDWKREVVIGDLKEQSINDIILSKKRRDVIDKINGAVSEKNFICKRCEKALGDEDGDKNLLKFNL